MRKKAKDIISPFNIINNDNIMQVTLNLPVVLDNAIHYENLLKSIKKSKNLDSIIIDYQHIQNYNSYLIILNQEITKYCISKNIKLEFINQSEEIKHFIDVFNKKLAVANQFDAKKPISGFRRYFSRVGEGVIQSTNDIGKFIEFFGDLTIKFLNLLIRPWDMRWRDFPYLFTRSGVGAVPITVLIVFLIGVISGYQGAVQLARFGADKYIADLIGISITRELAPLMTAILVAGRSGAAFAAEIGTMKVSEELDAMNSMGFDHIKFLILPRIIAVMLAMPILTLLTDVAGIFGGLFAALTVLDVTFTGYFTQMQAAISYSDLFTGLFKSSVFGFLVATIGCFRGLQVSGGAESVGKFTTAAVVTGVFLIILSDAVFTFLFQILGL